MGAFIQNLGGGEGSKTTRKDLHIDITDDVAFKSVTTSNSTKISDAKIETNLTTPKDLHLITGEEHTLVLDTEVWDDLRTPAMNTREIPGREAKWELYKGGMVLKFEATRNSAIAFNVQLPHNYKEGSDIEFHIHTLIENEGTGTIKWDFIYSWANISDDIPTQTVVSKNIDMSNKVANVHYLDEIAGVIDGTDKKISSMLICSLTRDVSIPNNFNDDVLLMEVDFHYQIDTVGSRLQSVK